MALIAQFPDSMLLLRMLAAHLVSDFLLQWSSGIQQRAEKHFKSSYVYVHGAITALVVYLFMGQWSYWWLAAGIGVVHTAVDIWKSYQKPILKFFLIDQLLHMLTLLLAWLLISESAGKVGEWIASSIEDPRIWLVMIGYTTVVWPAGYVVGMATESWRKEIDAPGLANAGKWIGMLERILILTFVLLNQFSAIGFLIAAKSVLRYSEVKENGRKEAEYVLVGTMLSFVISISVGLAIRFLLQ